MVRCTWSSRKACAGCDVYLLQPTSPPVEMHLLELLLLAEACRWAGAVHLTAVVPYLGYAHHDRRASGREPVAARLIADLLCTRGLQCLLAFDLHAAAMGGVFAIPLEYLSAVPPPRADSTALGRHQRGHCCSGSGRYETRRALCQPPAAALGHRPQDPRQRRRRAGPGHHGEVGGRRRWWSTI
jgi:ribose-phosphate pyrophosphokinase